MATKNSNSNDITHQDIAMRAYAIYLQEDCPDCRDVEHWQMAESQLLEEEEKSQSVNKTSTGKAASPRKTSK